MYVILGGLWVYGLFTTHELLQYKFSCTVTNNYVNKELHIYVVHAQNGINLLSFV